MSHFSNPGIYTMIFKVKLAIFIFAVLSNASLEKIMHGNVLLLVERKKATNEYTA